MKPPKFHDRKSLMAGVGASAVLVAIGVVLGLHCIDMMRYYKRHRIVKIEKTDTHRIVTKK